MTSVPRLTGRDYPADFDRPHIKQEYIHVPPGPPWYIQVKDDDLPSVFHVIRQALSLADDKRLPTDYPTTQLHKPNPIDTKVKWTLTRDLREKEYILCFTYLCPVWISPEDFGEICYYAPMAVNWTKTCLVSDDVHPRILKVHIRWLPYPAQDMDMFRAKFFAFYPYPVMHMREPTLGIHETHAYDRPQPSRGILQTIGGFFSRSDPTGVSAADPYDILIDEEDDDDDEAAADARRARKKNGEAKSKKRKLDVI